LEYLDQYTNTPEGLRFLYTMVTAYSLTLQLKTD